MGCQKIYYNNSYVIYPVAQEKKMKSRLLTAPALYQCTGTTCSNIRGKVRAFLALFANIRGKSAIFTRQTMRKLSVIHAPPCVMIACATRALTGVKNIEFSVLHVALPKLVRHREGETYCEVRVVRERRSPGVEGA